jgi:RNA polymerase sigma-70 factor (ECF subfamily)
LDRVTPAKQRMSDDEKGRPGLRLIAGAVSRPRREDEVLVAAFLVGDDDSFGELFRRHEGLVLSIVRRYARTPEDAGDLVQRTFLRAFQGARRRLRRTPRAAVPFRRWLMRVAVNLSKNHVRDAARARRVPLDEAATASVEPAAPEALLRREREARLRAAILRLPRRQREVVTLRIDAELSFSEIADVLEIGENAAKVSFHHATRKLRDVLAKEDP